jgi:hypothetical protein
MTADRERPSRGLRLEGVGVGDVLEIEQLGLRFHALVVGPAPGGGYAIAPLHPHVTARLCRPHEVVAHWERRGRPRRSSEPLRPSPRQLGLDFSAE